MIAVVLIPTILLLVFFAIYTQGSSHFASLFSDYEWDLDVWQVLVLGALGFFLAFNFFNYSVYDFFYQQNHHLKNDFLNEDKTLKPTYSFLDLNSERLSGIVSLAGLNILLVFFIITFNYEQFVEIPKSPNQLSAETHERVGAVIMSIVMAITVIMFYFKSSFNFDEKAKFLKMLAKIWIFLNAVLVISAFAKNSEYILNLGVTYKRLGVYAFLTLSIIGLFFTFIKISKQKTNAYLFNHMFWYFYGTILVCSFINWGGLATHYNIKNHKGSYPFLETLNFNDQILKENFPNEEAKYNDYEPQVNEKSTFLSKILYYEMLR